MPRFLRILFLVPFLFLPTIARADSVPALTIIGGTITGGRPFGAGGIVFNLTGIDPATGKIYNIQGGAEGGFFRDPFLAVARADGHFFFQYFGWSGSGFWECSGQYGRHVAGHS